MLVMTVLWASLPVAQGFFSPAFLPTPRIQLSPTGQEQKELLRWRSAEWDLKNLSRGEKIFPFKVGDEKIDSGRGTKIALEFGYGKVKRKNFLPQLKFLESLSPYHKSKMF